MMSIEAGALSFGGAGKGSLPEAPVNVSNTSQIKRRVEREKS